MPGHYNDKTMMMMNQRMADPPMMQSLPNPPMQPMPPMRERTDATLTPQGSFSQRVQSDIAERTGLPMSDVEKVQMLMDMGLTQDEAIEAVVIEKSMPPVMPREFGGARQAPPMGMGALGGVPMGGQAPMPMPTPRPQMPMDMGQDRTMNPMDRLTPRNVPST